MRNIVFTIIAALLGLTVLSTVVLAGPPVGIDELGRIDIEADKIVARGDLAYALDDGCRLVTVTPPEYECTGQLRVLASARQATPIVIGQFEMPDTAFVDLAVSGNYASIVAQKGPHYGTAANYRLAMVDVSHAEEMREVGSVELPIPLVTGFSLEVKSDFLYLASSRGGLFIYNISEPAQPVEVAQILQDTQIYDMDLERDTLFVAGPDGLRVMDVANLSRPIEVSVTPGDFSGVEVFGNLAFVEEAYICFTPDSPQPVKCGEMLVEFDVTDPANPVPGRHVFGGEGVNIRAVARANNFLLVAENKSVRLLDLEVPEPGTVASYQPMFDEQKFGSPIDIDVSGGLIYVTAHLGTEATSVRLVRIGRRWITYLPFVRRQEAQP